MTYDGDHKDGYEVDSNGRGYDPDTGNPEPVDGRCNALLTNYEERYGEPRYCGKVIPQRNGEYLHQTCKNHRGQEALMKSAEELMQTGAFSQTIDHVFDKYPAWKKVTAHGLFESLMGQSTYEYAVEYEPKSFDFSDSDFKPLFVDQDGDSLYDENDQLEILVGYPTEYSDQALALYQASIMSIMQVDVLSTINDAKVENADRPMESKTTDYAQLSAPPNEHDPSPQEFITLESWSEHHLNLPYSRLIKDRPKLLEFGGVVTDAEPEQGDTSSLSIDDIELEVTADPGVDDAPPNSLKDGAESKRIQDRADGE